MFSKHPRAQRLMPLWISILLLLIAAPTTQAEILAEQAQSGSLLIQEAPGHYQPASILEAAAQVSIKGMSAQVHLSQEFKNDSDQWREAVYVFPLPPDAAVYRMQMQIDERLIIGEIKERAEAKKIYDQAKDQGKLAALTEQERPNLFTQNVANIPPHARVKITIDYQHSVHYELGAFSWRLPLTLTPRYIPGPPLSALSVAQRFEPEPAEDLSIGAFGWSAPSSVVADAERISPPMRESALAPEMTIVIELDSGLALAEVNSLYHPINVNRNKGKHLIELTDTKAAMNRDFVLCWLPEAGHAPLVGVFSEQVEGQEYANIMLLPPQSGKATALERDIVFVIDTSGSMAGAAIRQAKQSLALALGRLKPGDRFNVLEFNSSHSSLFEQLHGAESSNIHRAQAWVEQLNAGGGTQMLPAFTTAMSYLDNAERLQQLVFITDGAIGNEAQLFSSIQSELGSARLFAVGIGSAPNSYFMKKAAHFGRGSATYIGDIAEVASKMDELFLKLESALVTNIQVDWGTQVEQYPQHIGDLYLGEPLLLSAKLSSPTSSITVTGSSHDQAWQRNVPVKHDQQRAGIARNWARAKIEALEDEKITGADPTAVRKSVLELALQHQLLSAYTSFVAIEQEPTRPLHETLNSEAIPNAMPQGSQQALRFSSTATNAPILWWLGALALLACLALRIRKLSKCAY